MWVIHEVSKINKKKIIIKIFKRSIKMQNLSKNELRSIAEKRSINGYKSMSKMN